MNIDLIGVLQDGSPLAPGVPANACKSISLVAGANTTIRLRVLTPAGVPVDLTTGLTSLVMAIRQRLLGAVATVNKAATLMPADGRERADFVFGATDLRRLAAGRYVYDVWMQKSLANDLIVPPSELVIVPASPVPWPLVPPSGPIGVAYSCPPTVALHDWVYLAAADAVDKASATDETKVAIGLVVDKPTTTSCLVVNEGEFSGFTGLDVTKTSYYLAEAAGQMTGVSPVAPFTITQRLGYPRNTTTFVVMVDRDYVVN